MDSLIWPENRKSIQVIERPPTSLIEAVHARKPADVKAFLDRGEDNLKNDPRFLIEACRYAAPDEKQEARAIQIVRLLLTRGANVNAATALGETALHHASYAGLAGRVEVLLEFGADRTMKIKSRGKAFLPIDVALANRRTFRGPNIRFNDVIGLLERPESWQPLPRAIPQP